MSYSALGFLISAWIVSGLLANAISGESGRARSVWLPAWLSLGMASFFYLAAVSP